MRDPLQERLDHARPYQHGDLRPYIKVLEAFLRGELTVDELTKQYQSLYKYSDVLWDEKTDRAIVDLWNFLEDIPFDHPEDFREETRVAAQRLLAVLRTIEPLGGR